MNTSKLTLAQQCKAFSDAAAYGREHYERLMYAHPLNIATFYNRPKHVQDAMDTHLRNSQLFADEAKRLQKSLNAQRGA